MDSVDPLFSCRDNVPLTLMTISSFIGRHGLAGTPGPQGEKGERAELTAEEKQLFRGSPGRG